MHLYSLCRTWLNLKVWVGGGGGQGIHIRRRESWSTHPVQKHTLRVRLDCMERAEGRWGRSARQTDPVEQSSPGLQRPGELESRHLGALDCHALAFHRHSVKGPQPLSPLKIY